MEEWANKTVAMLRSLAGDWPVPVTGFAMALAGHGPPYLGTAQELARALARAYFGPAGTEVQCKDLAEAILRQVPIGVQR